MDNRSRIVCDDEIFLPGREAIAAIDATYEALVGWKPAAKPEFKPNRRQRRLLAKGSK